MTSHGLLVAGTILGSLVVWTGLKISTLPPDDDYPYGHRKAESISATIVAGAFFAAAALIAVQSISELRVPHHAPAWFTLLLLSSCSVRDRVCRVGHAGPAAHKPH